MTTSLPTRPIRGLSSWFDREPFASLRDEMNDLLNRFSREGDGNLVLSDRIPSLDLAETDSDIEVKLEVPGIKADEIDIEVRGDTLHVSGEHKEEKEEKGKTYHRIERRSGSFSRTVPLPCTVNEAKATAECHDGVLTITLPKTEESKSRKIPVKA